MSTRKHLVAFAAFAIIVPPLCAETMIVKFDDLLTNETNTARWEYTNVKSGNNGHYIASPNSSIKSQQFNFAVTSVTVCVSLTPACNRNLVISPLALLNESPAPHCEFSNIPRNTETNLVANWEAASRVRLFTITATSGNSGNIYLKSAVISGVPLIEPPTNLQSDEIKGTRSNLSWENPENAVSNKIEVSQVVRKEEYSTMLDEYDFMALTNKNTNASRCLDKDNLQMDYYPAFSGTNIYAAGNSTGVVQISSTDYKGYLQYDFSTIREALNETANVSMLVSAKKHHTDTVGTWGLLITVSNITNTASSSITNELTHEFPTSPYLIPLGNITTNSMLILKPSDTTSQSKRRILIDYLAFVRDYSPSSVSTNLVKTVFATGNATTIRGLSPYSSYIASITAFDADGNESEPSEPISFMTNGAELPLVIRLQ